MNGTASETNRGGALRAQLATVAAALFLAGCGGAADPGPASPGVPSVATTAVGQQSVPPLRPVTPIETTSAAGESESELVPEEEPVIESCQVGLGPIETYWSDGSVTGWSDFCQQQHDEVLEAERVANQPQERQISWCGTDKNVYNRGDTFYSDGSTSSWTQYCADQFDSVNIPPRSPGMNGGGGAVAGPCDEEGVITYTPDGRKQQCSSGHWVYIR